jgi:hypothetical protein
MSYATLIHTRLAADATLVAIMTGGIVLYSTLKGKGVSRTTLPSAYTQVAGKPTTLKPLLVVKGRAVTPTNTLRDHSEQYVSTRQVVELWLYNDSGAGWTALANGAARAYTLLQDRPVTGSFSISLTSEILDEREPTMDEACFIRNDYEVIGRK